MLHPWVLLLKELVRRHIAAIVVVHVNSLDDSSSCVLRDALRSSASVELQELITHARELDNTRSRVLGLQALFINDPFS